MTQADKNFIEICKEIIKNGYSSEGTGVRTRWEDGTFDSRMSVAFSVKRQNPEIKVALLCDSVSDEDSAYRIKCAKKEGRIDAFFYESVPSDYLADVIDSL